MTIDLLGENIERENQIMRQVVELSNQIDALESQAISGISIDLRQKELLINSSESLLSQLLIINNAIPELINNISFYKELGQKDSEKQNLLNIKYNESSDSAGKNLAIKKTEEKNFLKNLAVNNSLSNKLKENANDSKNNEGLDFIITASNKLFGNLSNKLIDQGYFLPIKEDLRKITSPFLINSYVAMMFFTTFIFSIIGLVAGIILIILNMGLEIGIALIFLTPIITFFIFYLYPSSRKKSLEKEINQELPFVTIYMSAISTSGIEPSKIFDILVASKDYPFIQREMKKLTNLVNFYGYDLVTALKSMSKNSPSERLAQMLDGFATTITSGGELSEFLNKHSDSLLFDYRLEREKYTHVAETFMNIYISVVIAAPMIMMMLFILMGLAKFGVGLSSDMIGGLTILVIGLLNIGFLLFLNMKQPKF